MASRGDRARKPVVNMLDVIVTSGPDMTTSFNPAEAGVILGSLEYMRSHGPAIYGVKGNRGRIEAFDNLVLGAMDKFDDIASPYTPWEEIVASEGDDTSVTLTAQEKVLVRSLVSGIKERGSNLFQVSDETREEFNDLMTEVLSKLS